MGAVISGHTTHGSFVFASLCRPANLSSLLPPGFALMGTFVCFDIFSDVLFFERLCSVLVSVVDEVTEYYFECSFNC